MNNFKRQAAIRIALVTVALSALASPAAWIVSRENAEEEIVSFAQEDSRRLLSHHSAIRLDGPAAADHARAAARTLAGGLFEIVEIYGPDGAKLAETVTTQGAGIEPELICAGLRAWIP